MYTQHPTNPPHSTFTLPRAVLSPGKRYHKTTTSSLQRSTRQTISDGGKQVRTVVIWAETLQIQKSPALQHQPRNKQTNIKPPKKKPQHKPKSTTTPLTTSALPTLQQTPCLGFIYPTWDGQDWTQVQPSLQFSSLSQQQFNPSGTLRWLFANSINHDTSFRHIPSAPH